MISNKTMISLITCMQQHLFNHFCTSGQCGFLEDISLTFLDKTDPSDPLKREDYQIMAHLRLWHHPGLILKKVSSSFITNMLSICIFIGLVRFEDKDFWRFCFYFFHPVISVYIVIFLFINAIIIVTYIIFISIYIVFIVIHLFLFLFQLLLTSRFFFFLSKICLLPLLSSSLLS